MQYNLSRANAIENKNKKKTKHIFPLIKTLRFDLL